MDLKTLLEGFLTQHHDILINSDGLRSATMGLIDLMQVKVGHRNFLTHIDGQSGIDFVFATPRVVGACIHELPHQRSSGSTRIYFVKANGIRYGAGGGEMNEVCTRVLEGNIDIKGIAETKLDTKMACVVHTFHQSAHRHFDNSNLIMASSTRSYGSTYKPGCALLLSRGSVTERVAASGTDDMGRWCWTTYNGCANR
jgi:hypothetical protein